MKKTIILFSILNCFLTFIFYCTNTANAEIKFSIDPPIVRIQVKPGKAITKAYTIQNHSSQDKELVVRLVPFNKSDNKGNPVIDLKTNTDLLRYTTLSNTNIKFNEPFILKASSKEQIVLSIAIPENAEVEDLYATLLVSTYSNTLPGEIQGTSIGGSIGSNLLISVTPNLNPKTILKIENLKIISNSHLKIGQKIIADNLSPLKFQAEIANTGNHLAEIKGTATITKDSETISVMGVLPQYIISKNIRQILNNNGENIFSYQPSFLNFGTHKININIKSENANTNNSIEIIFVPFKIIIALIISLTIFKLILKRKATTVDKD